MISHSFSSLKQYESCPLYYYRTRILKDVKDMGGEASAHGERVHKELEEYVTTGAELSPELAKMTRVLDAIKRRSNSAKVMAEQALTVNAQFTPVGWFDKDAWLRTKIDVLLVSGNTAIILDWKTGKRRPDFDQLALYALQVMWHYPEVSKMYGCFVWLQDSKIDDATYTRDQYAILLNQLMTKVGHIEAALRTDTWPARPSGLCSYRPCSTTCKFARR